MEINLSFCRMFILYFGFFLELNVELEFGFSFNHYVLRFYSLFIGILVLLLVLLECVCLLEF